MILLYMSSVHKKEVMDLKGKSAAALLSVGTDEATANG